MSHKQKVAAGKGGTVGAALVAQAFGPGAKQGVVVETIDELAEQEADMIDKATKVRCTHWIKVFRIYGEDVNILKEYPKKVRHAYAAKLGLNLGVLRKEWPEAQRKLYDSFCANQVSPLTLMVNGALGLGGVKPVGVPQILSILERPEGTLPQKIQETRALLGKPKTKKGPNQQGNHQGTSEGDGSRKWDITDAQKKTPLEAVLVLIGGTLKMVECVRVVQGVQAKMRQSADPVDKLFAERLLAAIAEYDQKNAEPDEEDADGQGDEQDQGPVAQPAKQAQAKQA